MIGIPFRIRFSKSWGYPQIIPMSNNHCNIFQQLWWRKTLEISIDFSRSIHPSIRPSIHPSIHPSICKMRRFHGKTISGIWGFYGDIPSGKHTKSCGKSSLWMGKSTISMVIFNSYVKLRAGLRGVPEWSYERQWEAHFSAQAQCFMTLVHL